MLGRGGMMLDRCQSWNSEHAPSSSPLHYVLRYNHGATFSLSSMQQRDSVSSFTDESRPEFVIFLYPRIFFDPELSPK